MSQPTLYLFGGPNGAGKTTFAKEFLPHYLACYAFLNTDEIARGLSPLAPEKGQIQAGKILLKNFTAWIDQKKTFALESTLSGKTYIKYIQLAKAAGYRVVLHFLWLSTADLSHERVKQRVLEGGHAVPEVDIFRRYPRIFTLVNQSYIPLVDKFYLWNANQLPLEPADTLDPLISNPSHDVSEEHQLAIDAAHSSAEKLIELKKKLGHSLVTYQNQQITVTTLKS